MIIVKALKTVFIGLAIFALHGLLLWHLIQQAPAKTPLPTTPKPIMVNLITPPPPVKTPPPVQTVKPAPKKPILKKPVKKVKKVKRVKRVKKVKKIVKKRKKWVKKSKTKTRRVKPKTKSVKRQTVSHSIPVAQTLPMPTTRQTAIAQPVAKPIRTAHSSQGGQGNSRRAGRQLKVATTPPSYKAAYLHNPPPAYPRISKRRGEEGKVLLRVKVNQQGRAALVKLHQSSGSTRLDNAARKAVNRWRFVPAKKAGKTVSGWVIVPVVFKLR